MKQTAVQFLYEFVQLKLTYSQQAQFEGLFQQALEMEKEQIKNAYVYGCAYGIKLNEGIHPQQYYHETYETKTN